MKRKYIFYMAFLLLLYSCAGIIREVVIESTPSQEPDWIGQTLKHEGKFIYVTGYSRPQPNKEEAKDEALARATEEVAMYSGFSIVTIMRSLELSYVLQGNEIGNKADFEKISRIIAKAFVKRATPVGWYVRKMARMRRSKKISDYYLASVYLKVPEEEIKRIQKEKDIKLSLDIGIYYEDDKEEELKCITEGSILNSGDAYALYVNPTDNCYLYIFQVDDSGNSYRLFPNEAYNTEVNPLRPGEGYWIPNTEQYFVLDETVGKERFYLFASLDRIIDLEADSTIQQSKVDRVLKTMGVAGLKDKLNSYKVESPKRNQFAEVKNKLQAEGAFVYETWFWHK